MFLLRPERAGELYALAGLHGCFGRVRSDRNSCHGLAGLKPGITPCSHPDSGFRTRSVLADHDLGAAWGALYGSDGATAAAARGASLPDVSGHLRWAISISAALARTPTVIALVQFAAGAGGATACPVTAAMVGGCRGPVQVKERQHSAEDVGDEPLLMSAFAPVWVGRDRAATARFGAGGWRRGVDSVMTDFRTRLAQGSVARGCGCWPWLWEWSSAGPPVRLREPVAKGLARADMIVAIGGPDQVAAFRQTGGVSRCRCRCWEPRSNPLAMGLFMAWPEGACLCRYRTAREVLCDLARGRRGSAARRRRFRTNQRLSDALMTPAGDRGQGAGGADGHDRERRGGPATQLSPESDDLAGAAGMGRYAPAIHLALKRVFAQPRRDG